MQYKFVWDGFSFFENGTDTEILNRFKHYFKEKVEVVLEKNNIIADVCNLKFEIDLPTDDDDLIDVELELILDCRFGIKSDIIHKELAEYISNFDSGNS